MTPDEITKETKRLFGLLDVGFQKDMLTFWKHHKMDFAEIWTDPKHLEAWEHNTGKINTAAGTAIGIFYNLESDDWKSVDHRLIILEELAHCWFLATKQHSLHLYKTQKNYRDKCEKEAVKLRNKWFKKVRFLDSKS